MCIPNKTTARGNYIWTIQLCDCIYVYSYDYNYTSIQDCARGILVEVPLDQTMVKFLWKEERVLEVVDIVLV
jgi:hypothetical protein